MAPERAHRLQPLSLGTRYNTPGKSFGFAPSGDIKQEPADSTVHLRDSRQRLSWHIGQGRLGGYRAGERLDLNDETGLKKVIYVAGVPCADVADDWSYSGSQPRAPYASLLAASPGVSVTGVQHDVRDTFDASWTRLYDQPYSHATSDTDTNIVAQGYDGTVCVFVGAKVNSGAATFLLGAYAPASFVSTETALDTPHEYNGVLWYGAIDRVARAPGVVAAGLPQSLTLARLPVLTRVLATVRSGTARRESRLVLLHPATPSRRARLTFAAAIRLPV